MAKYKFGNEILDFDSDDDAISYAEDMGISEFTPITESSADMRARAKSEFAADWLAQKKAEAESIKETVPGKIASALFPRSVENEILQRHTGRPDSETPYLAYDALKDMTSLPGRGLAAAIETAGDVAGTYWGSKDYATPEMLDTEIIPELNPIGMLGERMANLNDGNLGKRIITDPLLPVFAGLGSVPFRTIASVPARVSARIASNASVPLADVAITKSRIGESPSLSDVGWSLAQGVLPEAIGKASKYVRSIPRSQSESIKILEEALENGGLTSKEMFDFSRALEAAKNPKLDIGGAAKETLPWAIADLAFGTGGAVTGVVGVTKLADRAAKKVLQVPSIRDYIDDATRYLSTDGVSSALSRAALRAIETLRFNQSDESAKRTLEEYLRSKNK